MATLTAWAFPGVGGADAMVDKLKALQSQELINIQWSAGRSARRSRRPGS
jgi:uncharacterized membrane protein